MLIVPRWHTSACAMPDLKRPTRSTGLSPLGGCDAGIPFLFPTYASMPFDMWSVTHVSLSLMYNLRVSRVYYYSTVSVNENLGITSCNVYYNDYNRV